MEKIYSIFNKLESIHSLKQFDIAYGKLLPVLFITTFLYFFSPDSNVVEALLLSSYGLISLWLLILMILNSVESDKFSAMLVAVLVYQLSVGSSSAPLYVNYGVYGVVNVFLIFIFINQLYKLEFTFIDKLSLFPAVSKQVKQIIKVAIAIFCGFIMYKLLTATNIMSLPQYLYDVINYLTSFINNLLFACAMTLTITLLWSVGINSGAITNNLFRFLFIVIGFTNIYFVDQAMQTQIVTEQFFDLIWMGGSGATLCTFIALFIISRKNKLAKPVIASSKSTILFNVNEPIIFGIPIVNNKLMLIPYNLVPLIFVIIQYYAFSSGLVPPPNGVIIPWTMPPLIAGFIVTGSIKGAFLQLVTIIIGTLIYLPFTYKALKHSN